jgi:hypothetical protein
MLKLLSAEQVAKAQQILKQLAPQLYDILGEEIASWFRLVFVVLFSVVHSCKHICTGAFAK